MVSYGRFWANVTTICHRIYETRVYKHLNASINHTIHFRPKVSANRTCVGQAIVPNAGECTKCHTINYRSSYIGISCD